MLEDWADESLYFYEMRLRFGIPANAHIIEEHLTRDMGFLQKTVAPTVRWPAQFVCFAPDFYMHFATVDQLEHKRSTSKAGDWP